MRGYLKSTMLLLSLLIFFSSLLVFSSSVFDAYINVRQGGNENGGVPNLEVGKEVRMNEKRNGKWVYKKLVDCGFVPSKTVKYVRHGVGNFDEIWIDPSNSYATTYDEHEGSVVTLPFVSTQDFDNDVSVMLLNGKNEIRLFTASTIGWRNNYAAIVCVVFTKKY